MTILFQSTCILLCLCFNSNVPQFVVLNGPFAASSSGAERLILQNAAYVEYVWVHAKRKQQPPSQFTRVCLTPPWPSLNTCSTKNIGGKTCVICSQALEPHRCAYITGPRRLIGVETPGEDDEQPVDLITHMLRSRLGGQRGCQMWRSGPGAASDVVSLFGHFARFPQKQHWRWLRIIK